MWLCRQSCVGGRGCRLVQWVVKTGAVISRRFIVPDRQWAVCHFFYPVPPHTRRIFYTSRLNKPYRSCMYCRTSLTPRLSKWMWAWGWVLSSVRECRKYVWGQNWSLARDNFLHIPTAVWLMLDHGMTGTNRSQMFTNYFPSFCSCQAADVWKSQSNHNKRQSKALETGRLYWIWTGLQTTGV